MKILITGDRNWDNKERIRNILKIVATGGDITIIHGGARGVDTLAGQVAKELGLKVEVYPANWEKYGRAAGPIRNKVMLDLQPDLVLAFHNNLSESKGTKDCVRQAEKKGITVLLFEEK